MKKYMLPLISATLCCATVLATDRTAETANHPTGGTGNWWLTADNWTPVGVPGDSDDCFINSRSSDTVCRFGNTSTAASFTGKSLQVGTVGGKLVVLVDESGTSTQ